MWYYLRRTMLFRRFRAWTSRLPHVLHPSSLLTTCSTLAGRSREHAAAIMNVFECFRGVSGCFRSILEKRSTRFERHFRCKRPLMLNLRGPRNACDDLIFGEGGGVLLVDPQTTSVASRDMIVLFLSSAKLDLRRDGSHVTPMAEILNSPGLVL